ncbi:hypothetical protein V5799_020496 [Amblyomma americanum]|uniref:RING-type E3 ubiquitin transferase n=1 Tax=Amblyomma americanum TaxID=6943 RepID=A0AAQ4E0J2_AMBAM
MDNVCRYYLQGNCMYGDRCRFEHGWPGPRAGQPSGADSLAWGQGLRAPNPGAPAGGGAWRGARPALLEYPSGGRYPPQAEPPTFSTSAAWLGDPTSETPRASSWAEAPEAAGGACWLPISSTGSWPPEGGVQDESLCPFEVANEGCPIGPTCRYLHRQVCDFCQEPRLHPYDQEQQMQHKEECVDQHEREMELAFAMQRSAGKTCGICMDVVVDREQPSERRFGLLERCSHVFCLRCIRHWRRSRVFDINVVRACPECRVPSDFVTPSNYWVDTGEEKDKLIADYKSAMKEKPCRYFRQGRGRCPFGGACFYKHEFPNGSPALLPLPRPRRRQNSDSEAMEAMEAMGAMEAMEAMENMENPEDMSLWVVVDVDEDPLPELQWNEVYTLLMESGFDWADFEEQLG